MRARRTRVLRARAGLLTCALLAPPLACRPAERDPPLLTLGEASVRRSEFERYVQALEARGGPLAGDVRRALLEPFLEERALALEARAREGLPENASAEQEQAAVRRLLAEGPLADVSVRDPEIEGYYRAHPEEFQEPERVTLRQILVPTENQARDASRRLARDPRAFEQLARTLSRGPEAGAGGLMGSFARGELPPEIEAAAFALPAGGGLDVIRTPLGYHVLKVDARQPARQRTLEEAREGIRTRLQREKSDRAVAAFVRGIMSRAKVNHEAALTVSRP